ncbi:MAG: hypothetical protein E7L17_14690 [Clostridium sp.]|uniref:hypothetical protein n=1 Tax=Clostridium sp. TaxID=1506 RepID=UPI002910644D|nr:hypothetical protein [Clostridium sp.]MDU7339348.1 hypothetical protein [Clostridium sp.]
MTNSEKVIKSQKIRLNAIEREHLRVMESLNSAPILGDNLRSIIDMRYETLKDGCRRRISEEQEAQNNG